MENPETAPRPRGRPKGQTKAAGHAVSPGRPVALDKQQQKRLAHWRQWWASRPSRQPSAYALARRMEEAQSTVRAYAAGTRTPGPVALANLESLSAAHSYQPLTSDYLLL